MKRYIALTILFASCFLACSSDDGESNRNPNALAKGELKADSIHSSTFWNDIELYVESGDEINFAATGNWLDWINECDADGYYDENLAQFNDLKRVPAAQWFELTASIDSVNHYILGKDTTITFDESGYLLFFANDAKDLYFNNSGGILLEATRIK